MKRIILVLLLLNIILPLSVHAALTFDPTVGGTASPLKTLTALGNNDPAKITYSVVNFSLTFLGLITLIMIIIGGFMWIFSAGNEERSKKATDIIKGAVLGLAVILASYSAAQYIFTQIVSYTTASTSASTSSGTEPPDPTP